MYEILGTAIQIQLETLSNILVLQRRLATVEGDSVESSLIERNIVELLKETEKLYDALREHQKALLELRGIKNEGS